MKDYENNPPLKVGDKLWVCVEHQNEKPPYTYGYFTVMEIYPRHYKKGKYAGKFIGWDVVVKGATDKLFTLKCAKTQDLPYGYYESATEAVLTKMNYIHHALCASFFGGIRGETADAKVNTVRTLIHKLDTLVKLYDDAKEKTNDTTKA